MWCDEKATVVHDNCSLNYSTFTSVVYLTILLYFSPLFFYLESGAMGSVLLGIVTHRDVDFLDPDSLSMRVTDVSNIQYMYHMHIFI